MENLDQDRRSTPTAQGRIPTVAEMIEERRQHDLAVEQKVLEIAGKLKVLIDAYGSPDFRVAYRVAVAFDDAVSRRIADADRDFRLEHFYDEDEVD